jgi:hypothetical protein
VERAPIPDHEVAAQLERVLASTTFRAAERSARLLRFIVSETLQGRGDRLKDYTLGAEGLGRGEGFDPRTDPIARVEASRLRSRLDVYYATEGAADRLRILVPKGGYVPVFEAHPAEPSALVPANAARQPGISPTAIERPRRASAWPMVWAAAAAAALAGGATWWLARLGESPSRSAEVQLELTTPPTSDPASLALSPDGRMLAFAARDGDVTRLWVRALGYATARPLPGTDFGVLPFWSPDGRSLGFFAEGRIKSIDLETRLVRTLSTAPVPAGAAWGRGDTLLHPLVPDSPLFRRTVSAGASSRPRGWHPDRPDIAARPSCRMVSGSCSMRRAIRRRAAYTWESSAPSAPRASWTRTPRPSSCRRTRSSTCSGRRSSRGGSILQAQPSAAPP